MALDLQFLTVKILTNDVKVLILSLSYSITTVSKKNIGAEFTDFYIGILIVSGGYHDLPKPWTL